MSVNKTADTFVWIIIANAYIKYVKIIHLMQWWFYLQLDYFAYFPHEASISKRHLVHNNSILRYWHHCIRLIHCIHNMYALHFQQFLNPMKITLKCRIFCHTVTNWLLSTSQKPKWRSQIFSELQKQMASCPSDICSV